ncbi:uncharacterized protein LOC107368547 [Tetranychus urticae]|uniref:Uncharacterized protein n=1 Tax=Tetranychus urticae TaxID=32264 RepID=T1JPW1_TETUR|nr:uncharacterized protein LOC107368547 [Tetranychus urticae]
MKSFLIVIALLVSTAYVGCSSNSELLDKLDDMLVEASQKNNKAAADAVSEAIDTVGLALSQMSGKDEATKNMLQSHIDVVRSDLNKLEKMVNQQIKSRAFSVGGAFNFVASRASLLTEKVQSMFNAVQKSDLGALIALIKPFLDNAMNDPQLKSMVGNLETVTSALEQLDKMTGGMFEPLTHVKDILANIDSTGKLFESMGSAKSSDEIADALINTLANAKSSHANKIEKALDYVCNGLADVEKSA